MRLAKSISINTLNGGYSIRLGYTSSGYDAKFNPKNEPIIDRIEVYFQEFLDHTESSIKCMSNEKVVREVWNCPVDIIYLEEATHD
jgi:hypothetical protein